VDKAGNEDRYSQTIFKDTQLPVLDIINPESIYEHDFDVVIDSDEPISISVKVGIANIPFDLSVEGLGYALTIDDINLAYGANTLAITTIDRAGNELTTNVIVIKLSSTVTFTVIAQNSYSTLKLLYAVATPTFTTTITANGGLLESLTVQLEGPAAVPVEDFEDIWSILDTGTYTAEFITLSIYGQSYSRFLSIEKDLSNPEITINTPVQDDFYDIEAPMYSISVTEPNIKRMWYSIVNSTEEMIRTITATSGGIDQIFWDNALTEFVTIEFGVEDLCGNIAYANVTVKRSDWIGPRGNGIDLGLFLNMSMNTLIVIGVVFGVSFASSAIYSKKKKEAVR